MHYNCTLALAALLSPLTIGRAAAADLADSKPLGPRLGRPPVTRTSRPLAAGVPAIHRWIADTQSQAQARASHCGIAAHSGGPGCPRPGARAVKSESDSPRAVGG